MSKKLALFLDGTWNTVASQTNVSVLHARVAEASDGLSQLSYYDAGVGTKRGQRVRGGALGYGLSGNIVDAYKWLVANFEDGDEIYLFGFSRGAYTARSVAGLIAKCGLLKRNTTIGVEDLFRRYQNHNEDRPIWELDYVAKNGGTLTKDELVLLNAARRVPIKFIGIWDTVGSLGIPFGNIPGLSRRKFQFHHTRLSTLFENVFHALALDEHRKDFSPTLWTKFHPKVDDPVQARNEPIVEQRWFIGAHADVGGGSEARLPAIPLAWLESKARELGLAIKPAPTIPTDVFLDPVSDSFSAFMWGLYRIAKFNKRFYRTIAAEPVEKEEGFVGSVKETIDESVFERYRADSDYRPQALLEWSRRKTVEIDLVVGTINA